MKTNITLKLDADLLREARVVAAEEGRSISALLTDRREIEERYQISFWDALVIHAATAAGAETLYLEDLSDGQRYGAVKVKNAFA